MKPTEFVIIRTGERVLCMDVRKIQTIDGEEFIPIRRITESRVFLMRKSALRKIQRDK